jgi:hypothetical protein
LPVHRRFSRERRIALSQRQADCHVGNVGEAKALQEEMAVTTALRSEANTDLSAFHRLAARRQAGRYQRQPRLRITGCSLQLLPKK